ncbi:galactose-3-O-sulfotransferase [Nitzschia inconspicua]|uniref:Galactose-3-O-sulfotransferase n=1 Tax=Nitzschia inconspicua TaxID=303405 RepID=A0A9K3LZR8_9STRA|nr:galactose-3-O-sulfotransferase [Nitzschia inconspicua]
MPPHSKKMIKLFFLGTTGLLIFHFSSNLLLRIKISQMIETFVEKKPSTKTIELQQQSSQSLPLEDQVFAQTNNTSDESKSNRTEQIQPRIWKRFPVNESICFPLPPNKFRFDEDTTTGFPFTPTYRSRNVDRPEFYHRGFLFNKPMKVGGSTAAGVLLRIAKDLAERYHTGHRMCDGIYAHTNGIRFKGRKMRGQSFLMSLLRDPTRRSISYFYHIIVSRKDVEPTLKNFLRQTNGFRNYYILRHTTESLPGGNHDDATMISMVNNILDGHDFIALTERFDESMVALQMILDVPLGDMLYVKAKSNGGYDGGGSKKGCVYIQPSNNLPQDMQQYIESDEWKDIVKWDNVLFNAVNQSLDATIDSLGRSAFEHQLKRFQHAQKVVSERCNDKAIFPCSKTGEHRESWETNCLFRDAGCGFPCLDEVALELKLFDYPV